MWHSGSVHTATLSVVHGSRYLVLGSLLLLVTSGLVAALPTDRQQPITIQADRADIDYRRGVSRYHGNVIITQGTTRLTGDTVTVHNARRDITKVVITGAHNRAYYEEQQPNGQHGLLQAWGYTIHYDVVANRVALITGAELRRPPGDTLLGDRIDYDRVLQTLKANSKTTDKGTTGEKVHMVIQPQQQPTEATAN